MNAPTPKKPSKPPLITPERLQRLSGKQFRAIQELVEVEDQRRFTAHLLRAGPTEKLTPQGARTERVKLNAEGRAIRQQLDVLTHRQHELWSRQSEVDNAIRRLHVEPLIGEFVSIINPGHYEDVKQLRPKAGDVGRLRKVVKAHALIDFGDVLRTWYIPLWAVGDVKDPFADDRPAQEDRP